MSSSGCFLVSDDNETKTKVLILCLVARFVYDTIKNILQYLSILVEYCMQATYNVHTGNSRCEETNQYHTHVYYYRIDRSADLIEYAVATPTGCCVFDLRCSEIVITFVLNL